MPNDNSPSGFGCDISAALEDDSLTDESKARIQQLADSGDMAAARALANSAANGCLGAGCDIAPDSPLLAGNDGPAIGRPECDEQWCQLLRADQCRHPAPCDSTGTYTPRPSNSSSHP